LLGRAAREIRKQHAHVRTALRHLLLQHLAGGLAHLIGGDVRAGNLGHHALLGAAKVVARVPAARHQVPHHGNRD
jgi:hypothetical protein